MDEKQTYTQEELNERLRTGQIRTVDKELQRKILKGEELTKEEKKQFGMDFEEWKKYRDAERENMAEGLRWGAWPILFICGFFLLTSAVSNTKYLRIDPGAGTSVWVLTIVSWILAAASIIGAFWMKNRGHKLRMRQLEREQELLYDYVHENDVGDSEKMSGDVQGQKVTSERGNATSSAPECGGQPEVSGKQGAARTSQGGLFAKARLAAALPEEETTEPPVQEEKTEEDGL